MFLCENVCGKLIVCLIGVVIFKLFEDFGCFFSGENFVLRSENVCSFLFVCGVLSLLRSEVELLFNVGVCDGGFGIMMLECMLVLLVFC